MLQIHVSLHCTPLKRMKRRDISLIVRQPDDLRTWLRETREYLSCKMQRERDYLNRRKTRGVHTSTDDDFESDQILEANLLNLLDEIAAKLEESV